MTTVILLQGKKKVITKELIDVFCMEESGQVVKVNLDVEEEKIRCVSGSESEENRCHRCDR